MTFILATAAKTTSFKKNIKIKSEASTRVCQQQVNRKKNKKKYDKSERRSRMTTKN